MKKAINILFLFIGLVTFAQTGPTQTINGKVIYGYRPAGSGNTSYLTVNPTTNQLEFQPAVSGIPLATPSTAGISKLYTSTGVNTDGSVTQQAITDALLLKAPLASPSFTGIPTVPTASPGTNTTQAASTGFVTAAVSNVLTQNITNGDTGHSPSGDAVYDALLNKENKRYGLSESPPAEIDTPTWDGFPEMYYNDHTGTIILTHKSGVAHQGAGSSGIRISRDGGETFGAYVPLINEPGKYNGLSGGGVTPTGRIILFYFVATSAVGTDEIGYIYSDDDAVTWSPRIPLSAGGDLQGAFSGKMVTIGDGKLMQCRWGAPEGSDYTTWNTKIYAIFSEDNGDTWGDEVIIASGSYATNNAYTECSFVYLEGGNIVGLIRKERQDYYQQFKSEDNGATWTNQGQATFEGFYTYPAKPEINTYTDIDGKRTVILYYSNRIDLWVRSIIGRDLLNGTSGWAKNTITNIAQNFDGDSGYPTAIHPHGSIYGIGAYYEAKSLSDADIRFFKSRPSNNTLIPNLLVGSDRALIKGGGLSDVGVYVGPAQTIGDAVMIAGVNNALTANKDLEIRSSNTLFTGGKVGINAYPSFDLDISGIQKTKRPGVDGGGVATVDILASSAKTVGDGVFSVHRMHDSSNTEVTYGGISTVIDSPTAGAISSHMEFRNYNAGVQKDIKFTKEGGAEFLSTVVVSNAVNNDHAVPLGQMNTALALKANIASPTFTGDPQAPTPTAGDNDGSIATSDFVHNEVNLGSLDNDVYGTGTGGSIVLTSGIFTNVNGYTASRANYFCNFSTTTSIELPSVSDMNGKEINFVKLNTNSVTITPPVGQTINGKSSLALTSQYDSYLIKGSASGTGYVVTAVGLKEIENRTGWQQVSGNDYTSGAPLVINAGTNANLLNNGATSNITTQLPTGVTSFVNTTTGKITPQTDGDFYIIDIRFKATSSSVDGVIDVGIDIGGTQGIIRQHTVNIRKGIGIEQRVALSFPVYSGSTFVANGGSINVASVVGNTSIYDVTFVIDRTHKSKMGGWPLAVLVMSAAYTEAIRRRRIKRRTYHKA